MTIRRSLTWLSKETLSITSTTRTVEGDRLKEASPRLWKKQLSIKRPATAQLKSQKELSLRHLQVKMIKEVQILWRVICVAWLSVFLLTAKIRVGGATIAWLSPAEESPKSGCKNTQASTCKKYRNLTNITILISNRSLQSRSAVKHCSCPRSIVFLTQWYSKCDSFSAPRINASQTWAYQLQTTVSFQSYRCQYLVLISVSSSVRSLGVQTSD